ncbi:MAG: TRAP transporter large permease subunit [Tropicimonas sp.]|uniref:TRAP transporter large permease subunit n=1 Tax=Tropicimonas sp. TaxID=2067044 RepID=UPI003A86AE40
MIFLAFTFIILLVMGAPIAITLGASSLAYILAEANPRMLLVVPQKLYQGTDNFILLAIPFYLLAGELMNATGITQRLIRFFTTLLGHVRGSLAQVSIVTSMMFSAISGTAASDAAAVGGVMIPAMKREGYDPAFAAAVQAASSTIAPIIPPSMVMILYAVFANISVAAIFAAGVIPGLLLGVGTFMDTLAALIIVVPMLTPVAMQVGIDPVHFGVVVCFAIIQGMLTLPLGLLLFIVSHIAQTRFELVIKAIVPFLAINGLVLLSISLLPDFVLFLPRLLGLME